MVHALEHIHRLLVPDGCLVDFHPTPEIMSVEIQLEGKSIFSKPYPLSFILEYNQANRVLAKAVQNKLFHRPKKVFFDFLVVGSSMGELRKYIDEVNAHEEPQPEDMEAALVNEFYQHVEETMQGMGGDVVVATRESACMSVFRVRKKQEGR